MRRVNIVADETSNLEQNIAKKYNINIIPFNVINKDGRLIKISPDQEEKEEEGIFKSKDSFFAYLNRARKKEDIPTTGAVSVERCKEFLKDSSRGKKDVLCILPPSELSRIFDNVERAAEIVSKEIGNRVKVLESKQVFSAQYFVIKESAERAARGNRLEEIVQSVERIRKKIHLLVAVYNLRFLRKSGRVKKLKKFASYLADIFGLASIITLKEGVPEPIATSPKARVENRILSEMEKLVGYDEKISVRINYGGPQTRARSKKIEKLIKERFDGRVREISSFQIGPLVGSHAGPHTLSVAVRKHGYEKVESEVLAEMFERARRKIKRNESTLNRLNIYPVIDADTGKNFSFTLRRVSQDVDLSSVKETVSQIASRACEDGTGFSGTAMAAYLTGFSSLLSRNGGDKLEAWALVEAMEEGTRSAYLCFRKPREGTILSAMRVSARRAKECLEDENDIAEILKEAYMEAVRELLKPEVQEVPILKRKGVVDAGGLAFIDTLEGWLSALGKEREIEDFIEEFRNKIKIQKSELGYTMEEARHPGFCLKIMIEGFKEKQKDALIRELESLPNPIESPLSTVSNIFHLHVYNQELERKALEICRRYGKAQILKRSPLAQKELDLIKNKLLTVLSKVLAIPKLMAWSFYWFGLRMVFPFREIGLWRRSRDLMLISKGLEDAVGKRQVAVFIFGRNRKIKYFNKIAREYAGELDISEIKTGDDIRLYLHPEFLRIVGGDLFSLGKKEAFQVSIKDHTFELKQLYAQNEHIGAKLEIE
ncbi:MAG: DegV family protein [Candidatus Aminicenantes bacterium]